MTLEWQMCKVLCHVILTILHPLKVEGDDLESTFLPQTTGLIFTVKYEVIYKIFLSQIVVHKRSCDNFVSCSFMLATETKSGRAVKTLGKFSTCITGKRKNHRNRKQGGIDIPNLIDASVVSGKTEMTSSSMVGNMSQITSSEFDGDMTVTTNSDIYEDTMKFTPIQETFQYVYMSILTIIND